MPKTRAEKKRVKINRDECYTCGKDILCLNESWCFRQFKGQPKKERPIVCSERCLEAAEGRNKQIKGTSHQTWKQFREKWKDCDKCPLHEVRQNIVLARGKIPCDVLFCGEAPGVAEDAFGVPFIGPAGKLLDRQIDQVVSADERFESIRVGFTNLVCCIPKETKGGSKIGEPDKTCIQACYNRLQEFVDLCKPKLIVFVGKQAAKFGGTLLMGDYESMSITRPAAILRAESYNRDMMSQKVYVDLVDTFTNVFGEK